MLKRISLVSLGVSLIVVVAAAQTPTPKSPCRFVTVDEAAAILGSRPDLKEEGDVCHYVVPKQSMQMGVKVWEVDLFFLSILRDKSSKDGYTVQDEPSLGKAAYSARKPSSLNVRFGAKGGVIEIGFREDEGKSIPAELLEKLRDAAKKAMNRV